MRVLCENIHKASESSRAAPQLTDYHKARSHISTAQSAELREAALAPHAPPHAVTRLSPLIVIP